jgi:hypothetical protein
MEKIQFLSSLWFTGDIQLPAENYGEDNDSNTEDEFFSINFNQNEKLNYTDIQQYNDMFQIDSYQNETQWTKGITIMIEWKNHETITFTRPNKKEIKLQLSDYYDKFYEFSQNTKTDPIVYFDEGMIKIATLNGRKNKKTNQYNIEYYTIMVFLK